MTTLGNISYEEFKQFVSDFLMRCNKTPAPTTDQLKNGLHMLRIGFLSLTHDKVWYGSAVIALQMAEKKAMELSGEVL
jgi:hypothetical protein